MVQPSFVVHEVRIGAGCMAAFVETSNVILSGVEMRERLPCTPEFFTKECNGAGLNGGFRIEDYA